MKKVVSLLFIAGAMNIVACGPSAEQKAKEEADAKAKMDSIFNAASQSITAGQDSIAPPMQPETTAPAMEEKK